MQRWSRNERPEARFAASALEMGSYRARAAISDAKQPFLDAILKILNELKDYWPVSERQIHYNLLNDPPLKHASKPDSGYRNDHESAKSLSDLATRARLEGLIPAGAIGDETRPVTLWKTRRGAGDFVEHQIKEFLQWLLARLDAEPAQPH